MRIALIEGIGYKSSLTQTGIAILGGQELIIQITPKTQMIHTLFYLQVVFSYSNNNLNSKTGLPTNATEFYNCLNGRWKDGSPIMAGCKPDSSMGTPTKFAFPDDPSIINGVSEGMCNQAPHDRKILISSGPFQLVPGIVPSDITFAVN